MTARRLTYLLLVWEKFRGLALARQAGVHGGWPGGDVSWINTSDMLSDDPTDGGPGSRPHLQGEERLALELIRGALKDAAGPMGTLRRRARLWLQDVDALGHSISDLPLSARVCFGALGIDYEAAIEAIRRRWQTNDLKGRKK